MMFIWFLVGLSTIGASLISQTMFSALRLGQFYLMPKTYCMVCLKAMSNFIVFGSKSQHKKPNYSFPVNILGTLISPIDAVRNLGVWFDSDFSFSCHVTKVCKACFAQVWDLK